MSKRVQVTDFSPVGSKRTINDSGFMIIADSRVARTGTQEYYAYELGMGTGDGWNPNAKISLYRPPEEVFHPESIASYNGKPITVDHKTVTAKNWKKDSVGDVTEPKQADDTYVSTTLTIKDDQGIKVVNSGKAQLSAGYSFELDMTAGVAPDGTAYDGVQRNIRINHVAIVDRARCGSACRVADHEPKNSGGKTMGRKIAVDGIPFEVEDDALAAVIEKLVKQAGDAEVKIKDLIEQVGGHSKAVADAVAAATKPLTEEIEKLRKDVFTPEQRDAMVADWAATLATAKVLHPGLDTKGKTCHAIRVETLKHVSEDAAVKPVLGAMLMGKEITDGLDLEVVRTAFNVAATLKPAKVGDTTHGVDPAVIAALAGKKATTKADDSATVEDDDGPEGYAKRQAMAWQNQKSA